MTGSGPAEGANPGALGERACGPVYNKKDKKCVEPDVSGMFSEDPEPEYYALDTMRRPDHSQKVAKLWLFVGKCGGVPGKPSCASWPQLIFFNASWPQLISQLTRLFFICNGRCK